MCSRGKSCGGERMKIKDGIYTKIVMRQARKEFDKRGDYCEHNKTRVCDDCLKAAVGLAKEQASKLTFSEKIKLLKEQKKT